MAAKLKPIHPGEILLEDVMRPLGLNPNSLAIALRVPTPGIYEIVKGARSISPDMAMRLSLYLGMSAEFWLNLQTRYDLETARDKTLSKLKREVRPRAALAGA